jgi:hypothetical protein
MSWCVVVTQTNCEEKVSRFLTQKGFEVYYPCSTKDYVKDGKHIFRIRAAFSRYIFVRVPCLFARMACTPGLESILKDDGRYAILRDQVVAEVQRLEAEGTFNHMWKPSIRKGDVIELHNGIRVELLQMVDRTHARVMLKLFGSIRETTLSVDDDLKIIKPLKVSGLTNV